MHFLLLCQIPPLYLKKWWQKVCGTLIFGKHLGDCLNYVKNRCQVCISSFAQRMEPSYYWFLWHKNFIRRNDPSYILVKSIFWKLR